MDDSARILCVDDEPAIRELLKAQLSRAGYEVVCASDGDEAVVIAKEQLPDLILMDLVMARMGGIDAAVAIKADPSIAAIPIVMISGAHNSADRVRAFDLGVDDFINKPFDRAELLARVRSLLRMSRLRSLMQENNQELRQAFENARDLQAKYQSLVGECMEAVFVVDASTGVVRECNPAAVVLTGLADTDLQGRLFDEVCLFEQAPENGEIFEAEIVHADGSRFAVDVRAAKINSIDNEYLSYVLLDRRALDKAKTERLDAERIDTIRLTAAAVNEEIGSALSVVINSAEAVRVSLQGVDSKNYTRLDNIVEAAKRIQQMSAKLSNVKRPVVKEGVPGVLMLDLDRSTLDFS
jgi:CheY-like chemotaxis protein